MVETSYIKEKDKVLKLKSGAGYIESDRNLAKLTDTGNGYVFKSYSWTSCKQHNYICMDYSEAHYLLKLLAKAMKDQLEENELREMLGE
jgi:hypothetical protein